MSTIQYTHTSVRNNRDIRLYTSYDAPQFPPLCAIPCSPFSSLPACAVQSCPGLSSLGMLCTFLSWSVISYYPDVCSVLSYPVGLLFALSGLTFLPGLIPVYLLPYIQHWYVEDCLCTNHAMVRSISLFPILLCSILSLFSHTLFCFIFFCSVLACSALC